MSEWQPIETAPFTETVLTLWDGVNNKTGKPVHHWEIAFKDDAGCWLRADEFNDQIDEPTHWMPLPAPPSADAKTPQDRPKDRPGWYCSRCHLHVDGRNHCTWPGCHLSADSQPSAEAKSLPEAPDPAWPATCSVCGVNPPSFWNRLIENFSCTPCFVRDADSQSDSHPRTSCPDGLCRLI